MHRLSAETRVRVGHVGAAEAVAKPPQGIRPVLEGRNRGAHFPHLILITWIDHFIVRGLAGDIPHNH